MWGAGRAIFRTQFWALVSCACILVLLRRTVVEDDHHNKDAQEQNQKTAVFFRSMWRIDGDGNGGGDEDASNPKPPSWKETRPVMYTFFERIVPSERSTGMADGDDERLLQAWEEAWDAAGWEPRVLTLDDALRHERFFIFSQTLDGLMDSTYQKLTFLRWLAMVSVGGGWMCDYDTFPLTEAPKWLAKMQANDNGLPNDGKLTFYDGIPAGGAVPSLVSGSAAEWDRVARLILDVASEYVQSADKKATGGWGDQRCVVELAKRGPPSPFVVETGVVKGRLVLSFPDNICDLTRDRVAIHLSHHGIAKSMKQTPADRAEIAVAWLKDWANECRDQDRDEQESLVAL